MKPIMMVLAPYLSTEDLFVLASLNRRMYTQWIHSPGCLDAIDLRRRVKERFGWTYGTKNPFVWVRRNTLAVCSAEMAGRTTGKFRCLGGCGKTRSIHRLINFHWVRYAMCFPCYAQKRRRIVEFIMERDYVKPQYMSCLEYYVQCVSNILTEKSGFIVLPAYLTATIGGICPNADGDYDSEWPSRMFNELRWSERKAKHVFLMHTQTRGYSEYVKKSDVAQEAAEDVEEFGLVEKARQWCQERYQGPLDEEVDDFISPNKRLKSSSCTTAAFRHHRYWAAKNPTHCGDRRLQKHERPMWYPSRDWRQWNADKCTNALLMGSTRQPCR